MLHMFRNFPSTNISPPCENNLDIDFGLPEYQVKFCYDPKILPETFSFSGRCSNCRPFQLSCVHWAYPMSLCLHRHHLVPGAL